MQSRCLLALLKAQVSLQLGNVSSSDNGISLCIMYSYTYIAYGWRASFKILNAYLMIAKCFCTYSEHIIYIWALISKARCLFVYIGFLCGAESLFNVPALFT